MEKHHIAIIPVMFVNYDLPDMADDCLFVCMPLCNSLGKSEPPPPNKNFCLERGVSGLGCIWVAWSMQRICKNNAAQRPDGMSCYQMCPSNNRRTHPKGGATS